MSEVGLYGYPASVGGSLTTIEAGCGPIYGGVVVEVTRPGQITGLSAVGGEEQVTLSWAEPDDGGTPLTGIIIQMAAPYMWAWFPYPCPNGYLGGGSSADASSVELFDGSYWLFPLGSATSITLANCASIQAGGTYDFRVMAVSEFGPAGFWGFAGPAARVTTE